MGWNFKGVQTAIPYILSIIYVQELDFTLLNLSSLDEFDPLDMSAWNVTHLKRKSSICFC